MHSTYLFRTKSGNHYLFDKKQKVYSSITEEAYNVYSKIEYKNDFIENASDIKENSFYRNKYKWLKEHGFFCDIDTKTKFSGRINEDIVKQQLANLKQLTFEVTDKCNLNCTYCAYGHLYGDYDQRKSSYLRFEDAKKIIDYLVAYFNSELNKSSNSTFYISFYGGEPLLGFNFIKQVVNYVSKLRINRTIKFSMTTNALLLEKYIDYLVEQDFNLLVSIDGDEQGNSYRVFRNGKQAYKNIISNIEFVYNKYPLYFKSNVSINTVLHNKNNENSIITFFRNRFNKTSTISPLNNSGIREEAKDEFNAMFRNINEYKLAKNEDFQSIKKDLFLSLPSFSMVSTFLLRNSNNYISSIPELFYREQANKIIPTGTCIPFSKKMFITVNKKIMVCERIGHEFYTGVIADNVILDFEKIVKDFNDRIEKIEKQCQKCYLNENCSQCLFYIENLDDNPVCKSFVNKKDYLNYLSNVFSYMEENQIDIDKINNEVIID